VNYGRAVKIARTIRGGGQADLAAVVGVSAGYISLIERGERIPSPGLLDGLSRALQIPLALLMQLAYDGEPTRWSADAEGALGSWVLRALAWKPDEEERGVQS